MKTHMNYRFFIPMWLKKIRKNPTIQKNLSNNMMRGTFVAYYISMDQVLVVDDNRDLGELTSEILEERGFRVNIAFDGVSALAKIKQEPYDLMILDYKLPRMSGLTVLERTLRIRPNLKTIMISAFGDNPIRVRAKELGAYAFLDKPFNIDGLVKVVKKTLKKGKEGIG